MSRIFIIEAKRTAIGRFLGSFYEADPAEVCVQLLKNGFKEEALHEVESVIIGNVISAGEGQGIARKIAVLSGIPVRTPAYSLNMVCGSGMQAVLNGIREIKCGAKLILCGGFEFMSNIPYATNSYIRLGKKFGDFNMIDLMTHDGLLDAFSGVHMGVTAENVVKECEITREEQDRYAYMSQQRTISAVDSGVFKDEIVPITLHDYRGREYVFDTDEFPNRESTPEKLKLLKPTFLKDGTGTVTAGNTSGINDGAAFLLLASEDYCREKNLRPIAEVIDGTVVGCEPQLMGLGPYYAIRDLLKKTRLEFKDIAYFEINEAFAAQVLGCYKRLAEDYSDDIENIIRRSNIHGSGLGLGHPLGATGARITATLSHILKRNKGKYGIASLCIGGGMGAALMLKGADNFAEE